MPSSIYHLEMIFNLNDRLFLNALAGVTEEQADERVSDHNNPLRWVAAHTVSARYNALFFVGKPVANPYNSLFENFRAYDPALSYPSLDEIKSKWKDVSALLKEALASVSDEHLVADSNIKTPIGDFTNGGTISFFAQHESYDVGQMAFLKKLITEEAMSYN